MKIMSESKKPTQFDRTELLRIKQELGEEYRKTSSPAQKTNINRQIRELTELKLIMEQQK